MANILIVEDEKMLNEAYSTILTKEDHTVQQAYDGEEALDITKTFNPDLILLDLRMPKMDGVSFLREYDLINKHPDVKVVVFSNFDMQKEVDDAYSLGAQRYILKAWASPKDLVQIVEEALEGEEDD